MFAVIRLKNRQYRVSEGDVIAVARMHADVGSRLDFDEVLLADADGRIRLGTPVISGAKVTAEVLSHGREPKKEVFKFRRRKNYRRLRGHRQPFTLLKVVSVAVPAE